MSEPAEFAEWHEYVGRCSTAAATRPMAGSGSRRSTAPSPAHSDKHKPLECEDSMWQLPGIAPGTLCPGHMHVPWAHYTISLVKECRFVVKECRFARSACATYGLVIPAPAQRSACKTQRTDVIAHPSESTNVLEGVHETHDAGGGARANNYLPSIFLFPISHMLELPTHT